ncbi:L2 [Bettongia penicillata papillomavirus 1]|uniref:Minor capsid protein L2 n=1 Tax=Bettongia penicillata papillomavirus 1 TaxID=759701 RepID=D6N1C3_9PAPI|nr:L2 [Bettongia penicillata papillomavirus 1]ADG21989.1 L2 [Bettongia penicillata papillomavirus 1]
MSVRRRKRASPEDIYSTCKISGTCPPDIIPKVENDTWADRLLKWFSSVVYFGNLGIGTGRGSGGASGYIPLGDPQGVPITPGGTLLRPSVPTIDPVGPGDVVPIDVLNPEAPSVFTPTEGPFDVAGGDTLPPTMSTDIELTDLSARPGPAVENEESAILDVAPTAPKKTRSRVTVSHHDNHVFEGLQRSADPLHDSSSAPHIIFESRGGGFSVGGTPEDVELAVFRVSGSGDRDGYFSSTPIDGPTPVRAPLPRRVPRISVGDQAFLDRPSSLVQFQYDNPVFDPDGSLHFTLPSRPRAAPDPAFTDIISLGDMRFDLTSDGRVRVSREGFRGGMRTRSALRLQAQVEFQHTLSTIDGGEELELRVFGSPNVTLQDPNFVDVSLEDPAVLGSELYPESLLEEEEFVDFSSSRLSFFGDRTSPTPLFTSSGVQIIFPPTGATISNLFPQDVTVGQGIRPRPLTPPSDPGAPPIEPPEPPIEPPFEPPTEPDPAETGGNFEPSLRKRKRKRVEVASRTYSLRRKR